MNQGDSFSCLFLLLIPYPYSLALLLSLKPLVGTKNLLFPLTFVELYPLKDTHASRLSTELENNLLCNALNFNSLTFCQKIFVAYLL